MDGLESGLIPKKKKPKPLWLLRLNCYPPLCRLHQRLVFPIPTQKPNTITKKERDFRYKESDLFEHVGPINRAIRTVDMVNPPKY